MSILLSADLQVGATRNMGYFRMLLGRALLPAKHQALCCSTSSRSMAGIDQSKHHGHALGS